MDRNNKVVPGVASNARLTRRQAKTVEVELDSGGVLVCTPDHPAMMRDGSYRDAGELQVGDFLMPYRVVANHKVVAVRPGPVIDTYDLTVDGYHNFAIGQGIVVHNSAEDVRFGRTVLRIQREVRNGLKKIASVDLAARRIDPDAVDFDIMMTVPSAIFELGQMEVRRARADLASMMERHVSQYWLLGNVYGLSDDEIAEITKQKTAEQKLMPGGGQGGFESLDPDGLSLSQRRRLITERELMKGNREHEKKMEEIIRRMMSDPSNPLGRQLNETGMLVREIANSMRQNK